MIKFVNAKINLGLRVLRRRADGYHDISTVFCPVGLYAGTTDDPGHLCDVLEITPSVSDSLSVSGIPVDCEPEQNLVWKALRLFRNLCPDCPKVQIGLDKHLPSRAGLGGGSADASFTLLALNEICGYPLDEHQLVRAAASLGADCPFFIVNRPCLASGVGDALTPIDLDLSGLWAAVVKPEASISTAQAFKGVVPSVPEVPVEEVISLPLGQWRDALVNDFEVSAFALHPDFREIKERLYARGAIYASMSGSGSAFYGVYRTRAEAERAIADVGLPFATVALL